MYSCLSNAVGAPAAGGPSSVLRPPLRPHPPCFLSCSVSHRQSESSSLPHSTQATKATPSNQSSFSFTATQLTDPNQSAKPSTQQRQGQPAKGAKRVSPRPSVSLVDPALESDFLQALEDQQTAAAAAAATLVSLGSPAQEVSTSALTSCSNANSNIHSKSRSSGNGNTGTATRHTSTTSSSGGTKVSTGSSQVPALAPPRGGFMSIFSSAFSGGGPSKAGDGGAHSAPSKPKPLAVVAMFTAEWCGPCSLLHKEIAHVPALFADPNVDLRILVLDVEDNAALASRLRIQSLPTLLFLGPDPSKPPIATTGVVKQKQLCDIVRSKVLPYAGCNLKAKPLMF